MVSSLPDNLFRVLRTSSLIVSQPIRSSLIVVAKQFLSTLWPRNAHDNNAKNKYLPLCVYRPVLCWSTILCCSLVWQNDKETEIPAFLFIWKICAKALLPFLIFQLPALKLSSPQAFGLTASHNGLKFFNQFTT